MARGQSFPGKGGLGSHSEEEIDEEGIEVRGGRRGSDLFRLDRQQDAEHRCRKVPPEVLASEEEQHLVEDQQGEGREADGEGDDGRGRIQGHLGGKGERHVGLGLHV